MFQTGNHEKIQQNELALSPLMQKHFEGHEIVGLIGSGRVTEVYLLREKSSGRLQALKVLNARHRRDEAVIRRFNRACLALRDLKHENILKVLDIAPLDFAEPYLLTRYAGQHSLATMLQEVGRLRESEVIGLFYTVSRALHFAHEHKVIHGGLEPTDLFIMRGDFLQISPVVADFGMSRVGADFNDSHKDQGLTGESFGNVRYMSPEQCRGELPSVKSDIYSLGCLMFESLTGKPAFALGTSLEVMLGHASGSSDFLVAQLKGRDVSPKLLDIVGAMLAPAAADRPASMGVVAARLKDLLPPVVAPLKRRSLDQSISLGLKSGKISKNLSDSAGLMRLSRSDKQFEHFKLFDDAEIRGGQKDCKPGGSDFDKPERPRASASPPPLKIGSQDPAERAQVKKMRLKSIEIDIDARVNDRLVVKDDPAQLAAVQRAQPVSNVVTEPAREPGSVKVADGKLATYKTPTPVSAVLKNPYFIVLFTVISTIATLGYIGPALQNISLLIPSTSPRFASPSLLNDNGQFERALKKLMDGDLMWLKIENYAGHTSAMHDLEQLVCNKFGNQDQTNFARYYLAQPSNFMTLMEAGCVEPDPAVRTVMVKVVHELSLHDTYARECLREVAALSRRKEARAFADDCLNYTDDASSDGQTTEPRGSIGIIKSIE